MVNIAAMVIGFVQRRQTVSEAHGNTPLMPALFFDITVNVTSMVESEINYNVTFEAPASNADRDADVGDNLAANLLDHDALFGILNATTGDLEDMRVLFSGSKNLSTVLSLTIINDNRFEMLECFTISIASPDVAGDRDIYECFNDDDNMDSFHCLHEICIEDDEGLFSDIYVNVLLNYIFFFSFQNHLLLHLLRHCILSLRVSSWWRCVSISLTLLGIFLRKLFV